MMLQPKQISSWFITICAATAACGVPDSEGQWDSTVQGRLYVDTPDQLGVFAGDGACEPAAPPAPYEGFNLGFEAPLPPHPGPLNGALLWDCRGDGCHSAVGTAAWVDYDDGLLVISAQAELVTGEIITLSFDVIDCRE